MIAVNPAASVFAASGDSASAIGAATAATTSPSAIHLLRLANMTSFLSVVSAAHAVVLQATMEAAANRALTRR